ncbi:MAG: hypothetical protein AB7C91_08300 [Sphaerochaeta sp.]|uniref:hypothetical protein n=1 Tax=Sphaerochaeta sp. TaxID=1972642 RepID=UPI003D0D2C03
MKQKETRIYFCPRFHVNFYHSYRGDRADEQGFGKDIRIIRGILDDLDKLQEEGIGVHCAWDFDNAFSLGRMIPRHAPDILARIKERVDTALDEIHLMSWNNGLLGAHTPEEFKLAIAWAKYAPDLSGNLDVFSSCTTIVRPQECMVSPTHLKLYTQLGVDTVSVYYSAIPFNGFGSFFPELPIEQRYNPMLLEDKNSGSSMRLLPAINQGDLAEYGFSARRMLKCIRSAQTRLVSPTDLIVILDMDADDTFWQGFIPGGLGNLVPSFAGLYRLLKSITTLDFVQFIKPSDYLATHPNTGNLSIGQDMADGAFDGYASWAEKYENHVLWAKITEARTYWDAAKILTAEANQLSPSMLQDFSQFKTLLPKELQTLATQAIATRLQVLSTTHFGLSAPVMNVHRLAVATALAEDALTQARQLFDAVQTECHSKGVPQKTENQRISWTGPPLSFEPCTDGSGIVHVGNGEDLQIHHLTNPWVTYAGRIRRSIRVQTGKGKTQGVIPLAKKSDSHVTWERDIRLDDNSQTLVLEYRITYPTTPHQGYGNSKADRLQRTWDARWKQTAPCEIILFQDIPLSRTITVWKQDFSGNLSSYSLDYAAYGKNIILSSINNHITPCYLAISDGKHGLLLAQNGKNLHSFAFCPLRQIWGKHTQTITANPFGTYWGRQYRYPAACTGWGRRAALLASEHLFPSAPSWEGKTVQFSLLIAPYTGDKPPQELCKVAQHFFATGAGQ